MKHFYAPVIISDPLTDALWFCALLTGWSLVSAASNGQPVNVNAGSAGRDVYIGIRRGVGLGSYIYDIALVFPEEQDPVPGRAGPSKRPAASRCGGGYQCVSESLLGSSAQLNAGSKSGWPLRVYVRKDTSHITALLHRAAAAPKDPSKPVGGESRRVSTVGPLRSQQGAMARQHSSTGGVQRFELPGDRRRASVQRGGPYAGGVPKGAWVGNRRVRIRCGTGVVLSTQSLRASDVSRFRTGSGTDIATELARLDMRRFEDSTQESIRSAVTPPRRGEVGEFRSTEEEGQTPAASASDIGGQAGGTLSFGGGQSAPASVGRVRSRSDGPLLLDGLAGALAGRQMTGQPTPLAEHASVGGHDDRTSGYRSRSGTGDPGLDSAHVPGPIHGSSSVTDLTGGSSQVTPITTSQSQRLQRFAASADDGGATASADHTDHSTRRRLNTASTPTAAGAVKTSRQSVPWDLRSSERDPGWVFGLPFGQLGHEMAMSQRLEGAMLAVPAADQEAGEGGGGTATIEDSASSKDRKSPPSLTSTPPTTRGRLQPGTGSVHSARTWDSPGDRPDAVSMQSRGGVLLRQFRPCPLSVLLAPFMLGAYSNARRVADHSMRALQSLVAAGGLTPAAVALCEALFNGGDTSSQSVTEDEDPNDMATPGQPPTDADDNPSAGTPASARAGRFGRGRNRPTVPALSEDVLQRMNDPEAAMWLRASFLLDVCVACVSDIAVVNSPRSGRYSTLLLAQVMQQRRMHALVAAARCLHARRTLRAADCALDVSDITNWTLTHSAMEVVNMLNGHCTLPFDALSPLMVRRALVTCVRIYMLGQVRVRVLSGLVKRQGLDEHSRREHSLVLAAAKRACKFSEDGLQAFIDVTMGQSLVDSDDTAPSTAGEGPIASMRLSINWGPLLSSAEPASPMAALGQYIPAQFMPGQHQGSDPHNTSPHTSMPPLHESDDGSAGAAAVSTPSADALTPSGTLRRQPTWEELTTDTVHGSPLAKISSPRPSPSGTPVPNPQNGDRDMNGDGDMDGGGTPSVEAKHGGAIGDDLPAEAAEAAEGDDKTKGGGAKHAKGNMGASDTGKSAALVTAPSRPGAALVSVTSRHSRLSVAFVDELYGALVQERFATPDFAAQMRSTTTTQTIVNTGFGFGPASGPSRSPGVRQTTSSVPVNAVDVPPTGDNTGDEDEGNPLMNEAGLVQVIQTLLASDATALLSALAVLLREPLQVVQAASAGFHRAVRQSDLKLKVCVIGALRAAVIAASAHTYYLPRDDLAQQATVQPRGVPCTPMQTARFVPSTPRSSSAIDSFTPEQPSQAATGPRAAVSSITVATAPAIHGHRRVLSLAAQDLSGGFDPATPNNRRPDQLGLHTANAASHPGVWHARDPTASSDVADMGPAAAPHQSITDEQGARMDTPPHPGHPPAAQESPGFAVPTPHLGLSEAAHSRVFGDPEADASVLSLWLRPAVLLTTLREVVVPVVLQNMRGFQCALLAVYQPLLELASAIFHKFRFIMKTECAVLCQSLLQAVLQTKTVSNQQAVTAIEAFSRWVSASQDLVEMYLNFDNSAPSRYLGFVRPLVRTLARLCGGVAFSSTRRETAKLVARPGVSEPTAAATVTTSLLDSALRTAARAVAISVLGVDAAPALLRAGSTGSGTLESSSRSPRRESLMKRSFTAGRRAPLAEPAGSGGGLGGDGDVDAQLLLSAFHGPLDSVTAIALREVALRWLRSMLKWLMNAAATVHLIPLDPRTAELAYGQWKQDSGAVERHRTLSHGPPPPNQAHKTSSTGRDQQSPSQVPHSKHGSLLGRVESVRLRHVLSGAASVPDQNEGSRSIVDEAVEIANSKESLSKAVAYLVEQAYIAHTPEDVVEFMRLCGDRIAPSVIGDYLGEGGKTDEQKAFQNEIRRVYLHGAGFAGLTFAQAMRHLLTGCGFMLPGEGQKIDRITTAFGAEYARVNSVDEALAAHRSHADTTATTIAACDSTFQPVLEAASWDAWEADGSRASPSRQSVGGTGGMSTYSADSQSVVTAVAMGRGTSDQSHAAQPARRDRLVPASSSRSLTLHPSTGNDGAAAASQRSVTPIQTSRDASDASILSDIARHSPSGRLSRSSHADMTDLGRDRYQRRLVSAGEVSVDATHTGGSAFGRDSALSQTRPRGGSVVIFDGFPSAEASAGGGEGGTLQTWLGETNARGSADDRSDAASGDVSTASDDEAKDGPCLVRAPSAGDLLTEPSSSGVAISTREGVTVDSSGRGTMEINGNGTAVCGGHLYPKNAEVVEVLSYSVIMLNTDAHTASIKSKMTLDQFIRNNRGIDNGHDLPASFLSALYADIVADEIKLQAKKVGAEKEKISEADGGVESAAEARRGKFADEITAISSRLHAHLESVHSRHCTSRYRWRFSADVVQLLVDDLWLDCYALAAGMGYVLMRSGVGAEPEALTQPALGTKNEELQASLAGFDETALLGAIDMISHLLRACLFLAVTPVEGGGVATQGEGGGLGSVAEDRDGTGPSRESVSRHRIRLLTDLLVRFAQHTWGSSTEQGTGSVWYQQCNSVTAATVATAVGHVHRLVYAMEKQVKDNAGEREMIQVSQRFTGQFAKQLRSDLNRRLKFEGTLVKICNGGTGKHKPYTVCDGSVGCWRVVVRCGRQVLQHALLSSSTPYAHAVTSIIFLVFHCNPSIGLSLQIDVCVF